MISKNAKNPNRSHILNINFSYSTFILYTKECSEAFLEIITNEPYKYCSVLYVSNDPHHIKDGVNMNITTVEIWL